MALMARPRTTSAPLNNAITASSGRVAATKDCSAAEFDSVLSEALAHLRYDETYTWDANINGVIVRYHGNSAHQHDFWKDNWWPAPNDGTVVPHGIIYSITGVPGREPHAFYCPSRNCALFINTEYYGQCKSWALGMAAVILERNFDTHSIHGACATMDGAGVVMVAPTGTGKTTQVNRMFQHPKGKVVGDDWVYVGHPQTTSKDTEFRVTQPERSLYVRTENALQEKWLRPIFDRCKLENVVTDAAKCHHEPGEPCGIATEGDAKCYWGFGNSRALLPREWMLGPEKVADEAVLDLLVLLRRDKESPAEVWLDPDQAVEVLREGRYMIRPGAGPKEKWGTMGSEPWYNPYLLVRDDARQARFFAAEVEASACVLLNTGVDTIEQTHQRIRKALVKTLEQHGRTLHA